MGQRNRPRPIPSLVEYKTIHLQDRYSSTDRDQLGRDKATLEQGQKGTLDSNGKPASASSPQLPPSLASYGGLHSFSQMAQFIPSICNQNMKRRPATLLPLTFPGLASKQMSEGTESTVKPFYRSSMPEAFLSASSNLINSSSAVPFMEAENFAYNQFGAKSSLGLQCIGKSGLELQKPSSKSEPSCKLKSDKLPPIKLPSHCTVHCTNCSCVHTKNRSPDKKNVKKDGKREPNAFAGRRKLKGGEPNGRETKPIRKSEKKGVLKAKQREKREPSVEAKVSNSSEQTQQSPHGNLRSNKDLYDDEEEGTSSHERRKGIHTSPRSGTSCKDDDHIKNQNKEDNEHNYFHGNVSILHPPPGSLQAITNPKVHTRSTSLFEDLGEHSNSQDNIGWAKDGFLEDSALRQALLLRNQALLYNTSLNNTTSVPSNNLKAVYNSVPCEKIEQEIKVMEEVTERRKSLKASADESVGETEGKLDRKFKDIVEKKLGQPQDIQSVTRKDVLLQFGAQKAKTSQVQKKQTKKIPQLNHIMEPKSQSIKRAKASRHPQKNHKTKHRDHTNCISTVPETLPEDQCSAKFYTPNLPPIKPQTLAINCGTRTSKSLGTLPGKEAQDMHNLFPDAAMLFRSPKFVKMFSFPVSKTRFPSSEQTGKEEKFEGHIDGKKVEPIGHLETGADEDQQEKSAEPPSKPK